MNLLDKLKARWRKAQYIGKLVSGELKRPLPRKDNGGGKVNK